MKTWHDQKTMDSVFNEGEGVLLDIPGSYTYDKKSVV